LKFQELIKNMSLMKKISSIWSLVFILVFLFPACNQNYNKDSGQEALSEGFIDPPSSSRPGAYWCWLNGNMTEEAISRDLSEMSEKGMGRAEIWDVAAVNNRDNTIPAGPAFLSDSSVALIKHALAEGKKYGIEIGMVGSSGWNAGGSWVEPEWASKALYYTETIVNGPLKEDIKLPFPEVPAGCPKDDSGYPVFYKEVAVIAFPYSIDKTLKSTGEIIDLTEGLNGNLVTVDLPAGEWIIMRFICSNNGQNLIVPSPQSGGLFIDFLDPSSTTKHLKHIMDRLGIIPGENSEGGLSYIEFDSMELAEGIAWTDSLPEIFKSMRGYDIVRYLPVLTGWKLGSESESFIYDWKKTLSDQLIFSHYTGGRKFLATYNVDLVAEAGGPGPPTWSTCPVDALKALGNVSIPRGEFWVRHRDIFLVKEIASASHIYGLGIVDAESFTTWRRWKDSPFDLKKIADRAFCEGLNQLTFHTFASTGPDDGLPGRTYHAGSDINHANTWWNKSGPFMDYLSRCSFMLQQGLFTADVCYYYGDQAPNFYPEYHVVPEKIIPDGLGHGYDYDVVNSDVILNRMSVEDGKIVLPDGLSYRMLVLPVQDDMPLEVLKKLESLVKEGATIIGSKPLTVPGLNAYSEKNTELALLANRMWSEIDGLSKKINNYGKGRIISGLSPREVLSADGVIPDFAFDNPGKLDYIHRQTEDSDIYFIRNLSEITYSGKCQFRSIDRFPELWDPSDGTQLKISEFTEEDETTTLDLEMHPDASVFIVFSRNNRDLEEAIFINEEQRYMNIGGPWNLTFPEGWGAPPDVVFESLISWTESDNTGIKYFSGTAAYHNIISVSEEEIEGSGKVELDLGEIHDVAEVFVNGKTAGIIWKKPYKVDISELVMAGNNEIKVEIVNQWVNRLTGDLNSDPEDRYCKTNQPYITSDDQGYDNWTEDSDETFRLKTSGLLGPVRLMFSEKGSN